MSAEKCQKQHLVAGGLGEDDHGEDEDERDARHDAADARQRHQVRVCGGVPIWSAVSPSLAVLLTVSSLC